MDKLVGKTCTHFKGGRYVIMGFAKHSEDHSDMVIYQSATSGEIWARPLELFFDTVTRDGKTLSRFTFDDDAGPQAQPQAGGWVGRIARRAMGRLRR